MPDPMTSGAPEGAPASPMSPGQPAPERASTISASNSVDYNAEAASNAEQASVPLASPARRKLAGAVEGRKNAAADLVDNFAQTVQRSGEQFAGQQDWIASAIQRGAAELNTLATSLRERDARDLLSEVQSFARQRPAVFIGGALAAGFAIARIGKLVAEDVSREDLPSIPELGHDR